jgi:TonB family protein
MRARYVSIPLVVWLVAAVCAHFFLGTGGFVVAEAHDDRSALWQLSRMASVLAQRGEQTFEVALGEPGEDAPKEPPPPPPPKPPAKPKPKDAPKLTDKKLAEAEKKKKDEEKKVIAVEKKPDDKQPLPPPEPIQDHRIAVRQHVKPDQEDNPNAKFIADEANKVDKETRATQTSHDRDDEKPSPDQSHKGAEPQPGDSEQTRIAENEKRAGAEKKAPGEKGSSLDVNREPLIPKLAPQPTAANSPNAAQGGQRAPNTEDRAASQSPMMPQPAPGGAAPESPEVESAADGSWSFNPVRPNAPRGLTPMPTAGGSSAPPIPGGRMWSLPGLGQASEPGELSLNLNQEQVSSIVGLDNLRRLREADGERRKSEHRGSWTASNFDRWRSAIENYTSSVTPGNQTALNTAKVPFASYLNGMHNRIHPIFAESFLESLDGLPPSHPMNDQHLITRLEIVLTREGRLKKMGVVKTSGITAFDIAALDAVDRAQPFGPAPSAIISGDGNVYLHWEFHRDEVFACSTMNARPFILNTPAPGQPTVPTPLPPPGPPAKERGLPPANTNESQEGLLVPPRPAPPARVPTELRASSRVPG